MTYITTIDGREYQIEVIDENHISVDGKVYEVDFLSVAGQPVYSLLLDGKSFESYVYPDENAWQVLLQGRLYPATVEDEHEKKLRASARDGVSEREEFHLKAPMPGLVVSVPITEGQEVHKGEVLVVLESMKMQNELKSPRGGVVSRLRIKAGDRVEQHQTLLTVS
jgi:biotin carboxyl carrier protein